MSREINAIVDSVKAENLLNIIYKLKKDFINKLQINFFKQQNEIAEKAYKLKTLYIYII